MTRTDAGNQTRTGARARLSERYSRFVEPAASGLPNWRVVSWFPALITLGAIVLIVLNISGTSSGAHWLVFGSGHDPRLILGGPRPIRTDEWLVTQSWISSQFEQGFPAINHTFPGGMNATLIFDLPTWDWSAFFRPQSWGYLLFGLDTGVAWAWWIPAVGLVSAAYLLVVTLLPRRAVTAAVIACAVFFSPMFQWWYGPNALWPSAWAFLAMTGLVWTFRDGRLWVRIVWAAIIGWLALTAASGLYVPFLVPPVLVLVFFAIGTILQERPWRNGRGLQMLRSAVPLIVAGVLSAVTLGIWVLTRLYVFDAEGATVYPGARFDLPGQLLTQDPTLAGIAGAPFGQSFKTSSPSLLGPNPSEAAAAILLGLFLLPALIWFIVRRYRATRSIDWVLVATSASITVVCAYLLVPGWGPIAHLLLLDRVPVSRLRIVFAVLMPLVFALAVREVDREPVRRNRGLALITGAFATILTGAVFVELATEDSEALRAALLWPVAALAIIGCLVLMFRARTVAVAGALLLIASMVIGAAVNPLYRGVFHVADTKIGKAVTKVEERKPGIWVGVGDQEAMSVVMSTGVEGYSGVQGYPSRTVWKAIDPSGKYSSIWNRFAHVRWTFGSGEPVVTAPERDQILATFDACSSFAQEHVNYVVADERPQSTACLTQLDSETQGSSRMQIYRVVPPSAG